MPAVTLKQSTTQRNQNWGSRIAVRADTAGPDDPAAASWEAAGAFGGRQSSAGTRISSQPMDMKTAYIRPITAKVPASPPEVRPKAFSRADSIGEAMSAPPPKPMMAMPVAMPGRSANHFISVETGEM